MTFKRIEWIIVLIILKLNEQFNQILRAKYILIRFELGNKLITLYQRKLDNKLSPVSTIKLFILNELLKSNLHMSLETVQIQEHHICRGSGNNLKVGQCYYLTDLIDNLTVSSSNTSAIVLQDYLEVSYEMDLVKHINKSNSLRGMRNSSLKNLHGLPERGQYFTLEDLSKFLYEKLYDDVFLEKLRIPSIQFESIGGQEVKEKNTCSFFYKFENEI